jgi:hypothetical protein
MSEINFTEKIHIVLRLSWYDCDGTKIQRWTFRRNFSSFLLQHRQHEPKKIAERSYNDAIDNRAIRGRLCSATFARALI